MTITPEPGTICLSGHEREQIERRGARARALGSSMFENPFLKPSNSPAATGETVEVWLAKHDAWERGWAWEGAMR